VECLLISEDIIQRVRDSNDIVDIISEVVKLKRSGRNYVGLCPFHNEKTPSFSVVPEKQIYKCFGCGEGGNIFSFVMKTKKVNYVDAIKYLAEKVNIVVEEKDGLVKNANDKIYKINVEAARYFYSNLQNNKRAKDYLMNRKMSETIIRKFGVGYSLDSWKSLYNYMLRKNYTELDMLNAGLIIKNEKGAVYDRFRNRIIFPVFDSRGKVIGFGGRVLDESKPKYLNSPETSLFKKGINLYGLNFVLKRGDIPYLLMVEGYMDCISLHQFGVDTAVASLGTALTVNQAKLIKKYTNKVIISYDADLAGQTATLRGLEILRKEGLDTRVLKVPSGKDPDEFIKNKGKDEFIKLIDEALPLIDYRIQRAGEGINFKIFKKEPDKIIDYVRKISSILTELDPVEKDIYIKKISENTEVKEQSIIDLLNTNTNLDKESKEMYNIDRIGQKSYLEPVYFKAERSLLKLMLNSEEIFNYVRSKINKEELLLDSHKKIYDLIIMKIGYITESHPLIEILCDDIESTKEWINIKELDIPFSEQNSFKLVDDLIKEIVKHKLESKKQTLISEIKSYEEKGMIDESLRLVIKLIDIQKEIGEL